MFICMVNSTPNNNSIISKHYSLVGHFHSLVYQVYKLIFTFSTLLSLVTCVLREGIVCVQGNINNRRTSRPLNIRFWQKSVVLSFFSSSLLFLYLFRPGQVVDKKVDTAVDRQEKLTEEGQQRASSNPLESGFKSWKKRHKYKCKVSTWTVSTTGKTSSLRVLELLLLSQKIQ